MSGGSGAVGTPRLPVMILAAGFGTRMGALTATRPKPLLRVAGQALIDHALALCSQAQGPIGPVVVNAHYRGDQIADHLAAHHPSVRLSHETPAILDSGGGVKQALAMLRGDPILSLNADAVWRGPNPIDILRAAWDGARMEALMLLVPRHNAHGRQGGGDVAQAGDGRLVWDRGPEAAVFTGAQILRTGRIAAHPDTVFSLREIWSAMMADGRLFGVVYPGLWADVGHPEGLAAAEAMLAND
jgi:MurNAc alpha-1-phosphate uridylyltransferase